MNFFPSRFDSGAVFMNRKEKLEAAYRKRLLRLPLTENQTRLIDLNEAKLKRRAEFVAGELRAAFQARREQIKKSQDAFEKLCHEARKRFRPAYTSRLERDKRLMDRQTRREQRKQG